MTNLADYVFIVGICGIIVAFYLFSYARKLCLIEPPSRMILKSSRAAGLAQLKKEWLPSGIVIGTGTGLLYLSHEMISVCASFLVGGIFTVIAVRAIFEFQVLSYSLAQKMDSPFPGKQLGLPGRTGLNDSRPHRIVSGDALFFTDVRVWCGREVSCVDRMCPGERSNGSHSGQFGGEFPGGSRYGMDGRGTCRNFLGGSECPGKSVCGTDNRLSHRGREWYAAGRRCGFMGAAACTLIGRGPHPFWGRIGIFLYSEKKRGPGGACGSPSLFLPLPCLELSNPRCGLFLPDFLPR